VEKTRKKLTAYWDNLISKEIPEYIPLRKIEDEIKEHFEFLKWAFKRIILPIVFFYVLTGWILNVWVFEALFICTLIFFYSNFLPDIDFLIKKTETPKKSSKWYKKYLLLFFAPIYVYYVIIGKAKPIYSAEAKLFHRPKIILIYGIFLLMLGFIFWEEKLKALILPVFGMLGFIFHLMVDGRIKNIFSKSFQKSILKSILKNKPID